MSRSWSRRAALALLSAATLMLSACGASSIVSQLEPTRIVTFGDTLADLGESGSVYSINDATINVWTKEVADLFTLNLDKRSAGGFSYGKAHARVNSRPDAVGDASNPSVKEQIDAFLASNTFDAKDLVLVSAGTSDLIAEMAKVTAGTQTSAALLANASQAGTDLGTQVRRMVSAGAKQVAVMGVYNLGRTPWATSISQNTLLADASQKFNEAFLISVVDLGANVLYYDAALLVNLMTANPTNYGFTNSIDPVCTSVDAGVGIGIGTGQVNSSLCTTSTLNQVDYNLYLFADKVFLAPAGVRQLGSNAYYKIRARW